MSWFIILVRAELFVYNMLWKPLLTILRSTERVLERGERIELLVDKTDNLNQQAFQFKKRSTQLKVCCIGNVRAVGGHFF